jgi:hypothetical protein
METGKKLDVQLHLSQFKNFGIVEFDKVLSIPATDRIPALVKEPDGYLRVATALTASIKSAMENINLKFPMTEDQIVELSGLIIDQSAEDNLSLEDVLLFLHELITGKAGKIFDRMDIARFFEMFENYRQERHLSLLRIREESHLQKQFYDDRASDNDSEKENMREAIGDYLQQKYKDEPKANLE